MVETDAEEQEQGLDMLHIQLFPDGPCRLTEPDAAGVRIDSNDLPVLPRDIVLLLILLPDTTRLGRLLFRPAVFRHGSASLHPGTILANDLLMLPPRKESGKENVARSLVMERLNDLQASGTARRQQRRQHRNRQRHRRATCDEVGV